MRKNLKQFLIYLLSGLAFICISLFFVFKFTWLGKVLLFVRVFLFFSVLYIILLFFNYPLEKKFSIKAKLVSLAACCIIFIAAVFTITYMHSIDISSERIFTCSMYHAEKDFDKWWEKNKFKYDNITKEEFKKFPFYNGITALAATIKIKPEDVRVGDIIVYYDPSLDVFIGHRVIRKWKENNIYFFETMGDNADGSEIINGSYASRKSIEIKLLWFFERDGCLEKQGDYAFCKGKARDLCQEESLALCCKINKTYPRGECFYLSSANPEPSLCCSVGDEYKGSCYEEFAIKTNDVKFCNFISKDNPAYKSCFFELAVKTSDASLCKKQEKIITGCGGLFAKEGCKSAYLRSDYGRYSYLEVDYCYKTVAEAKSNLQICDEIFDAGIKNECKISIAAQNLDINYCLSNSDMLNECLTRIAASSSSHLVCNLIDDANEAEYCYNAVGRLNFTSDCGSIILQPYKDLCFKLNAVKVSDCNKIQNLTIKGECYRQIEMKIQDEEECIRLSDEESRNMCFIEVSLSGKNVSLCSYIINKEMKDICFYQNALLDGNSLHCGLINSASLRDSCFFETAKIKGDEAVCKKIVESDNKSKCFYYAALVKFDEQICFKIDNSKAIDECIFETALRTSAAEKCHKIANKPLISECEQVADLLNKTEKARQSFQECWKNTEDKARWSCYFQLASDTNAAGFCSLIEEQKFKDSCYISLWLNGQFSGCGLIFDEKIRKSCIAQKIK